MTTRTPPLVAGFVAGGILGGTIATAITIAAGSPLAVIYAVVVLAALAAWKQLP